MKTFRRRLRHWRAVSAVALAGAVGVAGCGAATHAHSHAATIPPARQEALAAAGKLPKPQLQTLLAKERLHFLLAPRCALDQTLQGGRCRVAPIFKTGPTPPRAHPPTRASGILYGYDAVTLGYIPSSAAVVGCYVDGYANCASARVDFPHAHIVSIAIRLDYADFYDVEPGGGVSYDAHIFIAMMKAHRNYLTTREPGVYAGQSWIGNSIADLTAHGYHHGTDYLLWGAAWDGWAGIFAGEDGHQYRSGCCVDYDSFLASIFASAPAPNPKPKPIDYVYYCHTKPAAGRICPPYDVPLGTNDRDTHGHDLTGERSDMRLYDAARVKPQSGTRLKYEAELRDELHGLAIRLARDSRQRSASKNTSLHAWGRVYGMLWRSFGNKPAPYIVTLDWGNKNRSGLSRWLR